MASRVGEGRSDEVESIMAPIPVEEVVVDAQAGEKGEIPKADVVPMIEIVWNSFDVAKLKKVGRELHYVEPVKDNGVEYCVIESQDVEEDIVYWRNFVVCYVMGANRPYPVMVGYCRRIRKNLAIDNILLMKKRVFLVRFKEDKSTEQVLQQEDLQFDEKPLVIVLGPVT